MPKEIYIDENGNERILSSSPSALSGLLDTDITTPSANQVLAYDSNGKVVNTNLIVHKIISGTTDSDGQLNTGMSANTYHCLGVNTKELSRVYIPFVAQSDNNIKLKVCNTNLDKVTNTNVTLDVYFVVVASCPTIT